MKVLLANDSYPPLIDGVANTVLNYADKITNKYGEALVCVPAYPGAVDRYNYEVIRYQSIDTIKQLGYTSGFPFSVAAMDRITKFSPDIIHSHCPLVSLYLCREVRCLTGKPLILTYHTKFDRDFQRVIKSKLLEDAVIDTMIQSINTCDEVWAVNKGAGENLKSLGYKGEYIVMRNGVDIDTTPADRNLVEKVNTDCLLPGNVPVFLFVGRLIWYKGLHYITNALRILNAAGYDFRMIFVGKGEDTEEIKKEIRDFGISDKCIFTGPVYDRALLKAYYSRADMFLLPSVFDNNPLVVKEAAACMTPSILIKDSSPAEGVVNNENGILISEDSGELAAHLIRLIEHPGNFQRLGLAAQKTLYTSWDDAVSYAEARYREILKEHAGKSRKRAHPKREPMMNLVAKSYTAYTKFRETTGNIKASVQDFFDDFTD